MYAFMFLDILIYFTIICSFVPSSLWEKDYIIMYARKLCLIYLFLIALRPFLFLLVFASSDLKKDNVLCWRFQRVDFANSTCRVWGFDVWHLKPNFSTRKSPKHFFISKKMLNFGSWKFNKRIINVHILWCEIRHLQVNCLMLSFLYLRQGSKNMCWM